MVRKKERVECKKGEWMNAPLDEIQKAGRGHVGRHVQGGYPMVAGVRVGDVTAQRVHVLPHLGLDALHLHDGDVWGEGEGGEEKQ